MSDTVLCMGGPPWRKRREQLQSSVLGRAQYLDCPYRRTVGIRFEPGTDPLTKIEQLCTDLGFESASAARRALSHRLPEARMVGIAHLGQICIHEGYKPLDVLVEALILGLCTAQMYDPARPVIWTNSSLTRRLDLFSLGGFYAA